MHVHIYLWIEIYNSRSTDLCIITDESWDNRGLKICLFNLTAPVVLVYGFIINLLDFFLFLFIFRCLVHSINMPQ